MRSILVGTAGHVDHGKTALVRALTGIDCDRLAEEKRRGITLDLGFAHLETGGALLGFVDVPGHEHFLSNALAGLGGVRLLLLVVDATEGVRPQTREHLAIATLLGVPRLVAALTKVDALEDPGALELAELELAELLATTPYANAPIVRVSAVTGEGIGVLAATLAREALAAGAPERDDDPVRLPVDRAFLLKGQGAIVTGTLVSGVVAAGDELQLLPARHPVRARATEVHGAKRPARSGERVAIQLAGPELDQLRRGCELVTPGSLRPTRRLITELTLTTDAPIALTHAVEVRFHLFAGDGIALARPLAPPALRPGETGLVELILRAPVVAARGDRFVVRRPSPEALLGGGRVLDPFGRRSRARDASGSRLHLLLGSDDDVLVAWCDEAGARGVATIEAAARLGRSPVETERRLRALADSGRLIALGRRGVETTARYLAPETLARLAARAREALGAWFAERPLARGMSRADAVRLLLPAPARARAELFLDFLVRLREIDVVDGEIRLPGRSIDTPAEHSPLARAILERFVASGLTPASPVELTRDLAPKREIVEGLVQHLVKRGDLTRLSSGLVVATSALETLARDLRACGWEKFSVPQFKERFGLSRKWAIPLLEYLDGARVTLRVGDDRKLLAARESSAR